MKVLADGRWKTVDCGEVVGGKDWKQSFDWVRLTKRESFTPEGDQAMNQTNEAFRLGVILG